MKFLLPQVFKDFFRNLKWQTREGPLFYPLRISEKHFGPKLTSVNMGLRCLAF